MIAGLIVLDRVDGVGGLLAGLLLAAAATVPCLAAHARLTAAGARPAPEPTWLEALLVWAAISALLVAQLALGDPGAAAGRAATVLAALGLGALATEWVETATGRREPAASLGEAA
jgi:hypothetical protein